MFVLYPIKIVLFVLYPLKMRKMEIAIDVIVVIDVIVAIDVIVVINDFPHGTC